jgi:hypothetical protein
MLINMPAEDRIQLSMQLMLRVVISSQSLKIPDMLEHNIQEYPSTVSCLNNFLQRTYRFDSVLSLYFYKSQALSPVTGRRVI